MKITGRGMAAGVSSFIILLALMTTSFAQNSLLAGHWQLVSVSINGTLPYGASPQGSMFLDAAGHFSVIVITNGSARNIAYFGTYKLDDGDKSLTMRIEASSGGSGANNAGREEKRLITLEGDELIVQSQTPSGAPGPVKITWKRAN